MKFDKEEFKDWFSPEANLINPTIPPKNLLDLFYIPLWALTFSWITVPMAFLSSIKFQNKLDKETDDKG